MFKTQKGDFCMKKKTILSFAVALTLGLGVAVGLHANEAKGVEAAGTTVYCKNTQSWWKADGAAVGAYCWNSKNDSQKNANWPGVRMTAVSGETDLWTYTVPEAYDKIIFTRVNSSGTISDWGAKTADLTVPTDGKNMYEITSSSAVWGDPGVSGEWKTYPPEPDPTTHEYKYSLNGAAGVLMTEGSTNEVVSEVLSFKAGDKVTFTKDDAAYAVNPKDADTYTKVEKVENELVFVQDYEGALYLNVSDAVLWAGELDRGYYLTGTFNEWTNYKHAIKASAHPEEEGTYVISDLKVKENDEVQFINFVANQKDPEWKGVDETKLTIGGGVFAEKSGNNIKFTADGTVNLYFNSTNGWYSVVDSEYVPDVPEEDGYYLVGDYTHWKFTDAVKLGAGDEQNYAILENYTVTKDQKYKVRSYLKGVEEWFGVYNEVTKEEDDYVADATKAVNFYASKDGHLYVANYVPPVVVNEYKYSLNGAEPVAMLEHDEDEVKSASIAFKAGDELVFTKNDAAYDVDPKDDDVYTNVKKGEGKLIFTQDYEGELYLNFAENKLWAGRLQAGLYLLGVNNNWNVKEGIRAVPEEKEEPAYFVNNLELTAESKIKMIRIPDEGKEVTYFDAIENQVHTESEVAYSIDDDKNLVVTNAGTYSMFYNPTSGWYGIEDKNYVPDVPAENGYYLVGDYTGWKFKDAVKLTTVESDDNFAVLENYTVTKDQKYKVESYFDGAKEWWGIKGEEGAELDYVADATKAVTFYASKDGYLYVADYISSYTLTIGGEDVELTPAEGNEYSAKGVALKAGDKVTGLKAGTTAVEGYTSKKVGNNNLLEDLTVIANATADIYYDKNTKELFISGLPNGGYHIITGSGDVIQMTPAGEFEGYIQYKSEMISFAKDEVIQFLDTNGEYGVRYATVFNVNIVNKEGLGKNFEATEAGIVCKTACDARVYLKLKEKLDEIYFGEVEEYIQQAKNFADNFKTMMAQACSETEKQDAVEAKWDQAAAAYSSLSPEAKAELYSGSSSSVAEVREFAERYLAIASQHPDWDLENFLEWEIPVSSAVYSNIEFSEENNSLMIIIVVISAATIAGASVLLILKKKRHSK